MADIILATNSEKSKLALRNISCQRDEYSCNLQVSSDGFGCDRPFYFSKFYLDRFYTSLLSIDRSLEGECELRHEYEEDFIRIECNDLGHVEVSGHVVEHSMPHILTFRFMTDQSCPGKLCRDLKLLLTRTDGE